MEAPDHVVDCHRQPADLVIARSQGERLVEALRGDAPGAPGDVVHGREGFLGEREPAEHGDQKRDREQHKENHIEALEQVPHLRKRVSDEVRVAFVTCQRDPDRLTVQPARREDRPVHGHSVHDHQAVGPEVIRPVDYGPPPVCELNVDLLRALERVLEYLVPDLVRLLGGVLFGGLLSGGDLPGSLSDHRVDRSASRLDLRLLRLDEVAHPADLVLEGEVEVLRERFACEIVGERPEQEHRGEHEQRVPERQPGPYGLYPDLHGLIPSGGRTRPPAPYGSACR